VLRRPEAGDVTTMRWIESVATERGASAALLVVALLIGAPGVGPAPVAAQNARPDDGTRAEVLGVVTTLFDGMREQDGEKLRSVFHPDARLHTAGGPGGGTPIEAFIQSVLSGTAELDEVTFDEEVLADGPLAVAWTPYNLFVDGEFSHCGVDAFTMIRSAEGWRILQIVDTRVGEGCDPSRRG